MELFFIPKIIFGMYGVFLALLLTNLIEKTVRQQLLKSIGIFIVLNVIIGVSSGFVDNAAHLGGLISGFLIGFILYYSLLQPFNKIREAVVCLFLIIVVSTTSFVLIPKINNPIGIFIKIIDEFEKERDKGLSVYTLPENTSGSYLIKEYSTVSIPAWDSCEKILAKIVVKPLPEPIQKQVEMLKEYTMANKKLVALKMKSLEENSNLYSIEIDELAAKIKVLSKQLWTNQ